METIGRASLQTFIDGKDSTVTAKNSEVRGDRGHEVGSYLELARKVAELQFLNGEHVLLFRGQSADYRNAHENSSLKPTLLRGEHRANPPPDVLAGRFDRLKEAERALVAHYTERGAQRMQRQRITRWSVIQHYEISETPLLDLTHSLRVAASFASLRETEESFLFVLGVPHLGGALTASADAGIQIARLASMCPPSAVRPHIQEGYLLGEYPELSDFDQKSLYEHHEVDFGRRLVAKFRFNPEEFWSSSGDFPRLTEAALSPTMDKDPFIATAQRIKQSLPSTP